MNCLAVALERRLGFNRDSLDCVAFQDHSATRNRSPRDPADERGRLNYAALHRSRDTYRLATIVPGQHSVVRACSMLDFPTSGKGQTAVNAFRNYQRLEFCNARIDLFENSSGGSFENEASRSSAGAVANPSGFENSRANSTLRQVVGSRSTG